jgi:hypothetical protein
MDPITNFLIFPENLETLSNITNILFISDEIADYKVFYDSVNSTTFPILYSAFRSSKAEVDEVLKKFTSIQRIGFAFHSSSGNEKTFLDKAPLFNDPNTSGENVNWLIKVIKDYSVKNVDFLACDSLLYPNWVKYFDLLHSETGVIVGASNDKTGNIKYGGDWIMESTGEDVELIYFTKSIEYYKYLLAIITTTINGIIYDLNDATFIASVAASNTTVSGAVTIPSTVIYLSNTYNVTTIVNFAFSGNIVMTSLSIPASVTSIGVLIIYGANKLTDVTVDPANVKYTSIDGVLIDKSTSTLMQYPIGNTRTSYTVPSGILIVYNQSFLGCKALTTVTISTGVTNIGQYTFQNCTNVQNLYIPSTVTIIRNSAFQGCTSLTSIVFPPNLTTIEDSTCTDCTNLAYVTFGSGCTNIAIASFNNLKTPLFVSLKNSIYLPSPSNSGSIFNNNNTGYYKEGVLPPVSSGYGTNRSGYMNNVFASNVAQIIDPPQLPITVTTRWHLLSLININGITTSSTTGFIYLPYRNNSINPTVTATTVDPFSRVSNISGTTNLTPNAYNNITITVLSNEYNTYDWIITVFVSGPSCFLEGSKILCLLDNQEKYVSVENIRRGTLVKTLSSGYKPVHMIGHAKVYNSGDSARIKNRLFRCSKKNYPELFEDLIITGCHSILVGDITEEQRAKSIEYNNDIYITENRYRLIACLDDRAEPYEVEGEHPIWHLALENDDIYMNYGIFANGLLVETASKRMMKEYSGMELLES